MPLKIESSGSAITLRAQIVYVRSIFLVFGFGVPLLAWSRGHLKLDGSEPFVSYLVAILFVTLGLLVGPQPSIVIRIRRRIGIVSRRTTVPFATVEGLGLQESIHESGAAKRSSLFTIAPNA